MTIQKRVTFYADAEIEALLKLWSEASGASIGECVRRSIRFAKQYLRRQPGADAEEFLLAEHPITSVGPEGIPLYTEGPPPRQPVLFSPAGRETR